MNADSVTPSIRVEPATSEWIEALVQGDDVFNARFGIPVIEGWSGFPEALPATLAAVRANGPDPWGSHLFFDGDGALVGFGGFKGAPREGEVEIGYAIAPARQGRGLATAAARLLVERARIAGVERVTAHTLPERNASTMVLSRCGFRLTGARTDPDDPAQQVWHWLLDLGHDH